MGSFLCSVTSSNLCNLHVAICIDIISANVHHTIQNHTHPFLSFPISPAPPTIMGLTFDPITMTLTCISTGSPATIVTWIREGEELTTNGTVYTATQAVTNRRESTYENVLTIATIDATTVGTYSCSVENTLGTSQLMEVEVTPGELMSSLSQ